MNFLSLMQNRYTTKYYDPNKKISKDDIDSLLECLRLTPSSVNCQPWHFYVAGDESGKAKIRGCVLDFNLQRFDNCSHVIAICGKTKVTEEHFKKVLDKEESDGRHSDITIKEAQDKSRKHFTNLHAANEKEMAAWSGMQCYIALGTILYAAASMGIDSTPIEGFDAAKADELLGLKDKDLTCHCLVCLGYRDVNDSNVISKRPKSRLDKKDIIYNL